MPNRPLAPGDVLVFAEHLPLAQEMAASLALYSPTVITSWRALEVGASRARCIVLCDQAPDTSGLPARARHLGQRLTTAQILVVTTRVPRDILAFVGSGVADIRWIHDSASTLQRAVEDAVRRQPLDALAAQLQGALELPLYLRNTLVYLCRAQTCIRTVNELCEAAGCHRSTLWAQWRAIGADSVLRLQDVVDWVLLLRACSRRGPGVSWRAVALEAGVHEHTIARIAKRLMGCGLRELRHPLSVTTVHQALAYAVEPILAPNVRERASTRDEIRPVAI